MDTYYRWITVMLHCLTSANFLATDNHTTTTRATLHQYPIYMQERSQSAQEHTQRLFTPYLNLVIDVDTWDGCPP
jgi:hypothetical protein